MTLKAQAPVTKILLIEDEVRIAEFVMQGLSQANYQVEHVTDGISGLKCIFTNTYDLILLDLMLPKLNGLELLEQLRKEGNTTPVIILSAKVDLNDRLIGFETGADDYMPKPFFVEELVAKVKVLLRRHQPDSMPHTLRFHQLTLDSITRTARWFDQEALLSQREFTLLQYLMQTPEHIFSRQQILKNVWQIDFDPETNVVEVCVQRIKRKLNRGDGELDSPIESVRGVGYRLSSKPQA